MAKKEYDVIYASGKSMNIPEELHPGTIYFSSDHKEIALDPLDGGPRVNYLKTDEVKTIDKVENLVLKDSVMRVIPQSPTDFSLKSISSEVLVIYPSVNDYGRHQLFIQLKDGVTQVGLSHGIPVNNNADFNEPWVVDEILYDSKVGSHVRFFYLPWPISLTGQVLVGTLSVGVVMSEVVAPMILPEEGLDEVRSRLIDELVTMDHHMISNYQLAAALGKFSSQLESEITSRVGAALNELEARIMNEVASTALPEGAVVMIPVGSSLPQGFVEIESDEKWIYVQRSKVPDPE